MSTKIRLTYFGIDAEGPTVKAAKEAAGAKLEHFVKNFAIHIISHPRLPYLFLLWLEPTGYSYEILRTRVEDRLLDKAPRKRIFGSNHLGHSDFKIAVETCGRHLASLIDTGDAALAKEIIFTHCRPAYAEGTWQDWRRAESFQIAYRAAHHGTDSERHAWACEHCRSFLDQVPS